MPDPRLFRYFTIGVALGLPFAPAAALANVPAGPDTLVALAAPSATLTKPLLSETGAYPRGPIVLATNTAAGYGVEGITQSSGSGVFGYADSTAGGNGVYGYAEGKGRGVIGQSSQGNAVQGETAGGGGYGGYFVNTSGSATATAVGASASGNAIVGSSNAANGVVGNSGNGDPVAGVLGITQSSQEQGGNAGVLGQDNTNFSCGSSCLNYGVWGQSNNNGNGVYGTSGSGVGVFGQANTGEALYGEITTSGIALQLNVASAASSALIVASTGGSPVMSLDGQGNLILAGSLTQGGSPLFGRRGKGPEIESVGGARLVDGKAYVALDPDFARRLDPAQAYRVFVTPDGESEGLYVAAKTSTGFSVRENRSATSTLAFDYRVVGTGRRAAIGPIPRVRMPAHR
jgi:hypothetical protein